MAGEPKGVNVQLTHTSGGQNNRVENSAQTGVSSSLLPISQSTSVKQVVISNQHISLQVHTQGNWHSVNLPLTTPLGIQGNIKFDSAQVSLSPQGNLSITPAPQATTVDSAQALLALIASNSKQSNALANFMQTGVLTLAVNQNATQQGVLTLPALGGQININSALAQLMAQQGGQGSLELVASQGQIKALLRLAHGTVPLPLEPSKLLQLAQQSQDKLHISTTQPWQLKVGNTSLASLNHFNQFSAYTNKPTLAVTLSALQNQLQLSVQLPQRTFVTLIPAHAQINSAPIHTATQGHLQAAPSKTPDAVQSLLRLALDTLRQPHASKPKNSPNAQTLTPPNQSLLRDIPITSMGTTHWQNMLSSIAQKAPLLSTLLNLNAVHSNSIKNNVQPITTPVPLLPHTKASTPLEFARTQLSARPISQVLVQNLLSLLAPKEHINTQLSQLDVLVQSSPKALQQLVHQAFSTMISDSQSVDQLATSLQAQLHSSQISRSDYLNSFSGKLNTLLTTLMGVTTPTSVVGREQMQHALMPLVSQLVGAKEAPQSMQALTLAPAHITQLLATEMSALQQSMSPHSVQTTPTQADNNPLVQLFVPQRFAEQQHSTHLHLGQYRKKSPHGTSENVWFIRMQFDYPSVGEISMQAHLTKQHVRCELRSTSGALLDKASAHSEQLRQRLQGHGLGVEAIKIEHISNQQAKSWQQFFKRHSIVNIKI